MGKLRLGTGVPKKVITGIVEKQKLELQKQRNMIENALLHIAPLHRKLQHELCVCEHGASLHLGNEETKCKEVGCECKAYKSNHDQSRENYDRDVINHLRQEHSILPLDEWASKPEYPMHESQMRRDFENGVKPEEKAKKIADWLTAREENVKEDTQEESHAEEAAQS